MSRPPDRVLRSVAHRCKFVSQQSEEIQKKLIPGLKYCVAQPGTALIHQGCVGDRMFILFSGLCYAFENDSSESETLEEGEKGRMDGWMFVTLVL